MQLTIQVSLKPTHDKASRLYYLQHRRNCEALLPTLIALAYLEATYSLHADGLRVHLNCSEPFAIRDYMLHATPLTSPSKVTCYALYRFLVAPTYSTLTGLISHVILTLSIH